MNLKRIKLIHRKILLSHQMMIWNGCCRPHIYYKFIWKNSCIKYEEYKKQKGNISFWKREKRKKNLPSSDRNYEETGTHLKVWKVQKKLGFLWDYYKLSATIFVTLVVVICIFAHMLWEGQQPHRLDVYAVLNTEDSCVYWFHQFEKKFLLLPLWDRSHDYCFFRAHGRCHLQCRYVWISPCH